MAKILIKNGRVWDGERFSYLDVLTDGDTVVKMEQGISDVADFTYDATGKTVSAGLVDAHMHVRGISVDKYGTQGEASCFPFGVTAAADAGASKGDRALLDTFMLKTVVFVSAPINDNKADLTRAEQGLDRFAERAVGIKVYFDETVSSVSDVEPLRKVCAFAKERRLRVMVHCSDSPVPMSEILNTLNPGDILTHAFHGGKNNAADDHFESMKLAQKRGVIIDVGFAGHIHTDFNVLAQAIQSGVIPDVISTDITNRSAFTRGGRYGMTMCMNIAKTLGMREEDIFKAVTVNPAKALGKFGEWGSLKVGGSADIAVFDDSEKGLSLTDRAGNHIQSKKGYRCVLTVSCGLVIYQD